MMGETREDLIFFNFSDHPHLFIFPVSPIPTLIAENYETRVKANVKNKKTVAEDYET